MQVRNLGTVGGNIANGSPIGDTPPALIALGAELRLRKGSTTRDIPLEAYFLSYGKQDRRPREIIESVFIPYLAENSLFKVYKVSKRFDQDISAVCAAFNLRFDRSAQKIATARICFGGVAGTPLRATSCEQFLTGKRWTQDVVDEAVSLLKHAFRPITDWRASASYRNEVAGNLLRRCFLESASG